MPKLTIAADNYHAKRQRKDGLAFGRKAAQANADLVSGMACTPGDLLKPELEGEYRPVKEYYDRWRYEATCKLPPTDCPIEKAMREVRYHSCGMSARKWFGIVYREHRQDRQRKVLRALHAAARDMFTELGQGASRTTYALSSRSVLKIPNCYNRDNMDANLHEARLWRKYKRKATIKLAACRVVWILGVPCLVMQRVTVPGTGRCVKGETEHREAPPWAGRLDGYQCALTARGEWVAYDYGYQVEEYITKPLGQSRLDRVQSMPEAAE